MENIAVNRLMRLINPLSLENKLEILAKLSLELKLEFNKVKPSNEILLDTLFGAWEKMDDFIFDDILKSRSTSNKEISFD